MTLRKNAVGNSELHVDAGVLRYESGENRFSLRIADIVLFGEYTTSNGPTADDYFLVFFTRDGSRFDASFYSDGRDRTLATFSEYWHVPVELRLSASTSLASNIVWPVSHAGQELFEFHRQPATKLVGRLLERVGVTTFEQRLTPAAKQILEPDFQAMLDEARREFDQNPGHALELTAEAIRRSSDLKGDEITRVYLRGRAWKEHGNALFRTGRFVEAAEAARKAQDILGAYPELELERAAATLLMSLIASRSGATDDALALLDECATVFQVHGEQTRRLMAFEVRAIILFDLQRYGEALQTLRMARSETEIAEELARIDQNSACCLVKLGRLDEAKHYAEQAETRFEELGMESEVLRARWTLAEIAAKNEKDPETVAELERLKPEFEQRGMKGDAKIIDQEIAELKGAA